MACKCKILKSDSTIVFYCSGLAIAADKTMYIADGTNIRSVDPDGIIHTLIGHHRHHNVWQPIPCKGAIPAQQVSLHSMSAYSQYKLHRFFM